MQTQIDHLVIAASTLEQGVEWCEAHLGITPGTGGEHALFGTHNRLFKIATPTFPTAYFEIIAKACARLRQDRYAVCVVGEVRDKRGNYYDFVGDTVQAFRDAGLHTLTATSRIALRSESPGGLLSADALLLEEVRTAADERPFAQRAAITIAIPARMSGLSSRCP